MDTITELNYANDARNRAAPTLQIEYENDDGEWITEDLPTRWAVCSGCDGEGKHVNPSIDCNGMTPEDLAEDPDFARDYFGGTYDVTCYTCQGRTTVRVVDEDALTDAQAKALEDQRQFEAEMRAEWLAELRLGC